VKTRRITALLLVLGALLASVGTARAQTTGSIGIRILDAPTNRSDDPRAKVYIVDHVAPGTTISRRVEVSNDTDATQHIETYAAAASVKDGAFRFGDGHARNELSTWTTVEPSAADFTAGEKRTATVTIAVPSDASEGERYEVVWASVGAAAPNGGGIAEVNRVGVRVYLSVGPGGEPPSDFQITEITARRRNGTPEVTAVVKNTGGRALDLSGSLQLDDGPGALRAGPFPATLGTTLGIGDTDAVTVKLDKAIPAGPWRAKLTLESGLTKRSATATLTFPESGETTVSPDKTNYALPIGVAVLAVAGVVFFVAFLRRRHTTDDD
jgi:hypothetical protein